MAAQTGPALSTVLSSVIAHPLSQQQLDDNQSELSSALTDPDGYSNLWELTNKIMEFYTQTSLSDNTCMILISFRQMLSNHRAVALMTDIKTIGRDQLKLRSFSRYLVDTILKPMKLAGVVRSVISTPSSPRPNAAISTTQFAADAQPSDRSRQQYLKAECLKRDGFRCAFSHVIDRSSAQKGLVVPPAGMAVSRTQLSHILPLALKKFDNTSQREREAVASIWYALYRYFPGLEGKIGPESLNQHQNCITFESTVHDNYDSHLLAFNPLSGRPNRYEIKYIQGWPLVVRPPQGHQEVMTLASSDHNFPLPEPESFRVHYQIANILHVSGIRAEIEAETEASWSDPENLNPDGSTDLGSILHRKMLMNV
ncbi:hypothetical protein CI238_04621 [Colletotrichum incanum]|uniref:HNH nuclease domain-containing protein n=1 Tax=Colletotrichum incanum TaxID=1573173 RepID=A0A162N492_COLIC|nr:hypothetical protein CI238_04621 [Colletotrichum incanum]OHW96856.1 hypothetical protein CSPAE12_04443 [Colletotrichum incanum]